MRSGEKMRIAILAPHAGHMVGGVETAAKGLRDHIINDHECEIFSLSESSWTKKVPGIKASPSSMMVRRFRLNYLNHFIPYAYIIKDYAISEISYCFHLFPLLKRFNPHIIINFNFSIPALFCKYYRYKHQIPFVNVGEAGCVYIEVKSALMKPDVYVALTPVAKSYIEKKVPGVRVEVIPNGIDTELFSPRGPKLPLDYFLPKSQNSSLNFHPPFILSTSRLVKEKRLDLLIKAVSQLGKGTLILVGYGTDRQRLFELGKELLGNRFVILNTLSQEDLSKLYRSCDVFSLPSTNEAFGNVLVEAMASGLPAVATDEEGFQWIVGKEGGILVDVTDIPAYADALKRAYVWDFNDGPENQAQRFSWREVAKKYIQVMEDIIKNYP